MAKVTCDQENNDLYLKDLHVGDFFKIKAPGRDNNRIYIMSETRHICLDKGLSWANEIYRDLVVEIISPGTIITIEVGNNNV